MTTETQGKTNNVKISEALDLLNEAAQEKGAELKELMGNKYTHIREAMSAGAMQGKDVLKHAQDIAQEAFVQGGKKAQEMATSLDKRVRKDPWVYIAGVGAATLLLGYILGTKRK